MDESIFYSFEVPEKTLLDIANKLNDFYNPSLNNNINLSEKPLKKLRNPIKFIFAINITKVGFILLNQIQLPISLIYPQGKAYLEARFFPYCEGYYIVPYVISGESPNLNIRVEANTFKFDF